MVLYRIAKSRYASDLSGIGAKRVGARWNRKGLPVIYTASSPSLALLETIAHCQLFSDLYNRFIVKLSVPKNSIHELKLCDLDKNWNSIPWSNHSVKIGSNWIENNKFLLLKVPSAIIPLDFNYLINPNHKLIKSVKIIDKIIFSPNRRLLLNK